MTDSISMEEARKRAKLNGAGPLDGAALLFRIHEFLGRFVVYPSDHSQVAHTLWIVHAHLMDSWFTSPRLAFMSAEKESGKTRALEVTELLVPGPIMSISISPAAMVRKVAAGGVTILYDEIDALFGNSTREESNLDVRSVLNGGYRRGAKVHRCVTVGKKIETEELEAFAPVALAGLRELPDTLASRSIIVRMQRRAPDEHVESFRLRKVRPGAETLKALLEQWAASVARAVADAEPAMPDKIVDRAAECWEPLTAVADAAGGDWPDLARAAATNLVAGTIDDLQTAGTELLEHIRDAFGDEDKLWSDALLRRLHDRPESPWADIRGKPLDQRGLAVRLRKYRIKSSDIKIDGTNRKGYRVQDFHNHWKRLLPPLASSSATSATSATNLINTNKKVAEVAEVALTPPAEAPTAPEPVRPPWANDDPLNDVG